MGFVKGILPILGLLALFMACIYLLRFLARRWNEL
jgi:hypothetical protein